MTKSLNKYNQKRNFNKTNEPIGKISKKHKKLHFAVQHHLARKDHYDFRLELNGVLLSWAVPKGPSYNPKDKRLAIHVEDHPLSYRNFEGTIPKGEYGGGTVMLWDEGYYEPRENPNLTYQKGYLKFKLYGKRLKGNWTLQKFKEDNWLLIKEKDEYKEFNDILEFNTSIKTNRTMDEITNEKENYQIEISNPDKIIYEKPKVSKIDIVNYYEKVYPKMKPYLDKRIISTVRCPDGVKGNIFFKKHFEINKYLKRINIKNKNNKYEDYYYITDLDGLISEVQMNSIEFHTWGSKVNSINNPDIMVFDLDPDETLNINKVRQGVKDLKSILDEFNLKSYLKTSGGKGYHIVVPIPQKITWKKFRQIAKDIATLMEEKWPNKYTSNMRLNKRNKKIFIDWVRNTKGATSVAPYSLRIRDKATVSMPIKWSELDKIKPNEITIEKAIQRLNRKNPWADFFE